MTLSLLSLVVCTLVVATTLTSAFVIQAPLPEVPPVAPGFSIGSPSAPVHVVEYADLQCPDCMAAYPIVDAVMRRNAAAGKVFYTFRLYPLWLHHQAWSLCKATAIVAQYNSAHGVAARDDAVFAWLKAAFARQPQIYNSQWFNRTRVELYDLLYTWATTYGGNVSTVSRQQFFDDMQSDAAYAVCDLSMHAGIRDQVMGTPSFYINGFLSLSLGTDSTEAQWQAAIDALLAGQPVPEARAAAAAARRRRDAARVHVEV